MTSAIKKSLLLLFLPWVLSAQAGKPPLSEAVQQARLYRFNPTVTKSLSSQLGDKELLTAIARDTWGYFRDLVDKENGLPLDNVLISPGYTKVMSYTSTTNIGLYLMCLVAAQDMGFLSHKDAEVRLRKTLTTLQGLPRWEGQFFNYYETITLKASSSFVSSVDNGWLAAGLIVAGQAHPLLKTDIDALLSDFDFSKVYDPELGQLYGGYDARKGELSSNHYGLLLTEPRITSYIGIAMGDLPEEHWYKLFRTLPAEWEWQSQKPKGVIRSVGKYDVFFGTYRHGDLRFVPSWGGSMFEFLMPTLVINEQDYSPEGLGANARAIVEAQIRYALVEKRYPVWGISPCAIPDVPQGYKEYGVPFLGAKGYADEAVITPHASFLALGVDPVRAIENIRKLARIQGLYGEYGFYDSVDVKTGKTSPRYLALDQGMTLIAIDNHLEFGSIRERFMSHPLMKERVGLLAGEIYFQ
ncbi:MAG: DUF3131 domain-containing protein [Elusimicrobia bacterium]|nr:DUF3131 domain-containing protein [Elusimicrobiota bacterium]